MNLEEYYKNFDNITLLDSRDVEKLQKELILQMSNRDREDFYDYIHMRNNPVHKKPRIWKFIDSSLYLYSLFVYADNIHLQTLYKKYKRGDKSVLKRLEDYYNKRR